MLIEHLVDVGEAEAARELSVGDLDGFYKQARTKFDADEAFGAGPPAGRRPAGRRPADAAPLAPLVEESTRYFNAVYGRLGVLLDDDDLWARAPTTLLPEVVRPPRRARACSSSPTVPRSSSRPGSRTATGSRCR